MSVLRFWNRKHILHRSVRCPSVIGFYLLLVLEYVLMLFILNNSSYVEYYRTKYRTGIFGIHQQMKPVVNLLLSYLTFILSFIPFLFPQYIVNQVSWVSDGHQTVTQTHWHVVWLWNNWLIDWHSWGTKHVTFICQVRGQQQTKQLDVYRPCVNAIT